MSAIAISAPDPGSNRPDWPAIRSRYENGHESVATIAKQLGLSKSTAAQRCFRERWKQKAKIGRKLVKGALRDLEAAANAKARQMVANELAPYIERQKEKITRRGIKIGNRGLSRIEKLWRDKKQPSSTRDESDGARAAETFLRIARTSLGMGDGAPIAGPLSPILISHSAVQIVTPNDKSQLPNDSQS